MGYGAVTVATSAIEIVAANPNRIGLSIVNTDGTNAFYLGNDSSVAANTGLAVLAKETFKEVTDGSSMYKGAYYGISAGSINVRYLETESSR